MCPGSGDSHHHWPPTGKRKGDYSRSRQSLFFTLKVMDLEREGEGWIFIEKYRGKEREGEERERLREGEREGGRLRDSTIMTACVLSPSLQYQDSKEKKQAKHRFHFNAMY